MNVIPVIDLKAGRVVRGSGGQRDHYQPWCSVLCPDALPRQLLDRLLDFYPFETIYIADLDAITGVGNHDDVIIDLLNNYPDLTLWLDKGLSNPDRLPDQIVTRLRPVIGSESLSDVTAMLNLLTAAESHQPLLSLDFKNDQLIGSTGLLNHPDRWPEDVILMTLDRVGMSAGPVTDPLTLLPNRPQRLYAAGGVRDLTDLQQLATAGYHGALIASALHQQQLSGAAIAALADC